MDYYEILQVSRDATTEEIKRSFRKLARKYHPDLHPHNPEAQGRFREIYQAYETLSDAQQRLQYNQQLTGHHQQFSTQESSPKDFYVQGIEQALKQDYQRAVALYSQAIKLKPDFLEAYLKRCEAHYHLGDTRGVLEDCQQILQLDNRNGQAYYYRGRVRYRLGYSQSAIEAYGQAIEMMANYGPAYYHRGLAYYDLQEYPQALEDWQIAAELFRQQEDWSSYRLVQQTLKKIGVVERWTNRFFLTRLIGGGINLCANTCQGFINSLFNPVAGLPSTFANLDKYQALGTGFMLGLIADASFVIGIYGSEQIRINFSLIKLGIVGITAFLSLVLISLIARLFVRNQGSWQGDVFLAGAALLPLGLLVLVSGLASSFYPLVLIAVAVLGICNAILTLYSGYTQISYLPEAAAARLVPMAIIISGGLSYLVWLVMDNVYFP